MTIFWPLSRQQVLDLNGRPRLDLRAQFFEAGSTTPRSVYADAALSSPLSQPVACDASGRFPRVYLGFGQYRERVSSVSDGDLWNDDGLGLPAPESPDDPTPVVPANAYSITGDTMWRMDRLIRSGWVRMNNGTIGNAASGASERGDADTAALFSYLFTTFPDDIAPVIGGRGASAAADFAAGKRIIIPSMRGLLQGGLDDMGTGAARQLQTITGLTLTPGSTSAAAFSGNRLAVGMFVIAPGISAGTTIADLNGNLITLSQPAAAGASSPVEARFSFIPDAQAPGQIGGDALSALSNKNLPAALPGAKVFVDYPAHEYVAADNVQRVAYGDAGAVTVIPDLLRGVKNANTAPPDAKEFTVSQPNPGGGQPVSNLPPMRLGTFYMKL